MRSSSVWFYILLFIVKVQAILYNLILIIAFVKVILNDF